MKFKDFNETETGWIEGFSFADTVYRQKLLRMGLTRKTEFKVVRKSFLGGPIEIEVRGSRLMLRAEEADVLEVERK